MMLQTGDYPGEWVARAYIMHILCRITMIALTRERVPPQPGRNIMDKTKASFARSELVMPQ
jgi:hypothetical protein